MSVKVLMVCLGNICRSPLAEGILQAKLPKNYTVDSAGTANYHVGTAPDKRSVVTAKKFGVDISQQKCRQISKADFEIFDYIYVMDSSNYNDVVELAKTQDHRDKVQMILNDLFPNENVDVPDPYFGLPNGFEIVYNMLDEACDVLAKKLIENHY